MGACQDASVPVWDSEIEVNADLASGLIAEQFPLLEARPLWRIGEGWDNTVWLNSQDIAFRFPRREVAIPGVEREIAVLPELSAQLPAPIPDARYVGAATAAFPWPWFGSRLIRGTEIATANLGVDQRGQLAFDLGVFLACLHCLQSAKRELLPVDPMGRADMATRIPRARAAVEEVAFLWAADDRVERILSVAAASPADTETVIVHGDLNVRHALVSASGALAGVIDWGDMCRASRSVDLPLYWSLFDHRARIQFRSAYGMLSESALAHARVLALFMDATLALYAHEKGMDHLKREALRGLERTATD